MTENCSNCRFMRINNDYFCKRYPPGLTGDGPVVVKDPMELPKEIPMHPMTAVPIGPKGDIYRLLMNGQPMVKVTDWCGEWRG